MDLNKMLNEKLNVSEIQILAELFEFYNSFGKKIEDFDFTSLKPSDLMNFRNYIIYVFNPLGVII